MSAKIQTYSELQKMIRKALREQHPEWVDANGKCTLCDSYEVRFAYLLGVFASAGAGAKVPLFRLSGNGDDFDLTRNRTPFRNQQPKGHPMTTTKKIKATQPMEMTGLTNQIKTANTQTTPSFARGRALLVVLATISVLAALFFIAMTPRWRATAVLGRAVRDQRPTVSVVSPQPAKADLVLPGFTEAIQETAIYARTNGYVRRWLVDIGAKVEAGQLLADIETPEVDQELNQARASREQAAANLELARVTLKRWQDLLEKDVVSAQEFDEKRAGFNARRVDFDAAQENAKRLEERQAFQKIIAPFSGIVTARDIGDDALVSAGSASQGGALFRIAQTDPLRIYLTVPQSYAGSIANGRSAAVSFREFPHKIFPAKVVRTSGALDPMSHTLLTELQVPNADGQLRPGMSAEIKFELPEAGGTLLIPGSAVVVRPSGAKVMTVDAQNAIRFRPVKLGRDLGDEVEILSGLDAGDSLVANSGNELHEGLEVKVQRESSQNSAQQPNAKSTEKKP
jgi:RND family efflux transporter MFP subunit